MLKQNRRKGQMPMAAKVRQVTRMSLYRVLQHHFQLAGQQKAQWLILLLRMSEGQMASSLPLLLQPSRTLHSYVKDIHQNTVACKELCLLRPCLCQRVLQAGKAQLFRVLPPPIQHLDGQTRVGGAI
mmetsp:Transcript_23390/g.71650  ORF Transcript_23390/g.71650 Transcript_23390/m.71650 type:complete len:127 (-) Transcript_23390:135-515(-)